MGENGFPCTRRSGLYNAIAWAQGRYPDGSIEIVVDGMPYSQATARTAVARHFPPFLRRLAQYSPSA